MSATLIESPAVVEASAARGTGDLAHLLSTFHDVASRLQGTHEALRGEVRRLEAELREARQQLHRARELAALGEMAAGIAHEVRNPLGSIRLYAGMLSQDLADRPSERGVAEKIASAVGRLDAVVGDVLCFAREVRVRREPASGAAMLCNAAEACADLCEAESVTVHSPTASAGRVVVACDPGLMHQALVNVMRNACEAMRENPPGVERSLRLMADSRRVAGADGRRARMWRLAVADSGPGVSGEVRERMFNPFFTTRHTGTGLGLAIVHRIIDAHGGRVVIENNASRASAPSSARGATVEFLLPVLGEAEDAGERLEAA